MKTEIQSTNEKITSRNLTCKSSPVFGSLDPTYRPRIQNVHNPRGARPSSYYTINREKLLDRPSKDNVVSGDLTDNVGTGIRLRI